MYYHKKPNGRVYDTPANMELRPGTSAGAEEGSSPLSRENYVLPLKDLFHIIRRRLWIILLVVSLLVGSSIGVSLMQTPLYEGSIKILVGQKPGSSENPIGVYDLQQLTQTMAEALNSRAIADSTIRELGLAISPDEFLDNLNVEQVKTTQLVQVSYSDPDPANAQVIVNAVGNVFSRQISQTSANANPVTATVWEQAERPDAPSKPDLVKNIGLALIVGLVGGLGLAFLLEFLDDRWRSPEEVEEIAGAPTLGVIPISPTTSGEAKDRRRAEKSD